MPFYAARSSANSCRRMRTSPKLTIRHAVIMAVVLAGLCGYWFSQVTGSEVKDDAGQNLTLALNLQRNHVISMDWEPPYRPSMHREPVPVATTALAIAMVDAVFGKADLSEHFSGDRARYLKYQNVLWLILLWTGVFFTAYWFTSSFALSLAGAVWATLPFSSGLSDTTVDSLCTELPAAALLVIASAWLVVGTRKGRPWFFVASGVCFGLLALTKAAVLYVFLGLVALLLLCYAAIGDHAVRGQRVKATVAMVLAFAAVVLPWMYRNLDQLGVFQISARGGETLMGRALLNQMSWEEYRGTLYAWGRRPLRPIIGRILGFSPSDLERGGRLARLNDDLGTADFHRDDVAAMLAGDPDAALSFYMRVRAENVKVQRELEQAGHANPEVGADRILQARALQMIKADMGRHLAMTIPLIYRGATVSFAFLVFALGYCLLRRDYALSLFIVPALALLGLYALLSNVFITRYELPALPVATVVAFALLHSFWRTSRMPHRIDATSAG